MRHKIFAVIAAALVLAGCGRITESDAPGAADSAETEAASVTTTTTAPEETAPEETSAAGTGAAVVDPEDEEQLKDSFRAMFGYKTRAEKEREQYWSTYTTTTMTTTDRQQYLESLITYNLTVDETGLVTRDGELYDDLTWVIKVNGITQLERNASGEMTYRPMNYGEGKYQVYLESFTIDGYQPVSNTVEFRVPDDIREPEEDDDEIFGFEYDRVSSKKNHMKHLVQTIYMDDGYVEYKMGFVIDPDHDGYCNGVVFCAGLDDKGSEVQYVYDNDSSGLHFRSEDGPLGIWFDGQTGQEYIVSLTNAGAVDCCTGEIIENFAMDDNYFTYSDSDKSDRDHFYVSKRGVPVFTGA